MDAAIGNTEAAGPSLFHSVIIPSVDRPECLQATLRSLAGQTRRPDEVLIVIEKDSDYLADQGLPLPGRVIRARRGLTAQRNAAVRQLDPRSTLVSFFDDDVELAADYLEKAQVFMAEHVGSVLMDGHLVANQDMSRDDAQQRLLADDRREVGSQSIAACYGCNMTVRAAIAREVCFDERLPLYGWLEDADFSARCRAHGTIARYHGCRMVHRPPRTERLSGQRFGFSQVMNPFYLWRKGSIASLGDVIVRHWVKGVGANVRGVVFRDKTIDRDGRLRGNLQALSHIVRGQIDPEFIERIKG